MHQKLIDFPCFSLFSLELNRLFFIALHDRYGQMQKNTPSEMICRTDASSIVNKPKMYLFFSTFSIYLLSSTCWKALNKIINMKCTLNVFNCCWSVFSIENVFLFLLRTYNVITVTQTSACDWHASNMTVAHLWKNSWVWSTTYKFSSSGRGQIAVIVPFVRSQKQQI